MREATRSLDCRSSRIKVRDRSPLATNTAWHESIRKRCREARMRSIVAFRQKHMRYDTLIAFIIFTSCFQSKNPLAKDSVLSDLSSEA